MSIQLSRQLLFLANEDPKADISLYINSPGGSVTAGLGIIDTMRFVPCDVGCHEQILSVADDAPLFFRTEIGQNGERYLCYRLSSWRRSNRNHG